MTNYSKFKEFIENINWYELRHKSAIPSEVHYLNPSITLDSIDEEKFSTEDFLKFKNLANDVTYIYTEDTDDEDYYDYENEPEVEEILYTSIHDATLMQCRNGNFMLGVYVSQRIEDYNGNEEERELFCGYWDGEKWTRNH